MDEETLELLKNYNEVLITSAEGQLEGLKAVNRLLEKLTKKKV